MEEFLFRFLKMIFPASSISSGKEDPATNEPVIQALKDQTAALTQTMEKQTERLSADIKGQRRRIRKLELGLTKVTDETAEKFHQQDKKIEDLEAKFEQLEKKSKSHQVKRRKRFSMQAEA